MEEKKIICLRVACCAAPCRDSSVAWLRSTGVFHLLHEKCIDNLSHTESEAYTLQYFVNKVSLPFLWTNGLVGLIFLLSCLGLVCLGICNWIIHNLKEERGFSILKVMLVHAHLISQQKKKKRWPLIGNIFGEAKTNPLCARLARQTRCLHPRQCLCNSPSSTSPACHRESCDHNMGQHRNCVL